MSSFFEYVGLAVVFYSFIVLVKKIVSNIGSFYLGLGTVDFKAYGSWAVVTGATDGIGKSFSIKLAARGLNIVLISRNNEKLENLASYLHDTYDVKTRIISADFTGFK